MLLQMLQHPIFLHFLAIIINHQRDRPITHKKRARPTNHTKHDRLIVIARLKKLNAIIDSTNSIARKVQHNRPLTQPKA
jgi:hypothetical protein